MEQQLVIFNLANEQYGVDISAVESIIKMQPITAMPHSPAFIEGVINLRGKILPVIDLRKRMDMPSGQETRDSRIVVVDLGGVVAGLIVDAVSEVMRITTEMVEPAPALTSTVDTQFIRGIANTGSDLIILLDLKRILSDSELSGLEQVAVEA